MAFFSDRLPDACVRRCGSVIEAAHIRNVLEAAGIPAEVRNDRLWGALGEIPLQEAWPQVWVEPRDAERARALLRQLERGPVRPAWTCPKCGESLEGQFTACWSCGSERASESPQ
jgi:hypothetical protein